MLNVMLMFVTVLGGLVGILRWPQAYFDAVKQLIMEIVRNFKQNPTSNTIPIRFLPEFKH